MSTIKDPTRSSDLLRRLRALIAESEAGADRVDSREFLALGAALHQEGALEAALAAFEAATVVSVPEVSWWHAVATLRLALNRPRVALLACNEALRLEPEAPATLFNTGVVFEALGDVAAAEHCYRKSLGADEGSLGVLVNLVPLMLAGKRCAEALGFSEAALRHHAADADCWFNHGEVMTTLNRHEEALIAYERALQLRPQWGKADVAATLAMAALGQVMPATQRLALAEARDPLAVAAFHSPLETDHTRTHSKIEIERIALIAAYQRYRICDWSKREHFVALFRSLIDGQQSKPLDAPDMPFLSLGLPLSGDHRLRLATQVAGRVMREAAGGYAARAVVVKAASIPRRLRIGYLSGDFRRHATAWLMSRLPRLHDRAQFEIFLYSSGPDDGSDIRAQIVAGSEHFHDVQNLSDTALAQRIAMDGVDILVDLAGYTLHSRPAVLAQRPAPVQVSYLVYLQTSGAAAIDYVLLDRQVLTERERPYWTEKIVFMPYTLYLCDDQMEAAEIVTTRGEEGLPEGKFVFCCLNAAWKIDPDTFAVWMEILNRVPNAVLWLYADIDECKEYLRRAAQAGGVDAGRLIFAGAAPHELHLARFRNADVFLDTFSCNAHTTAIEALAAGIPVLTLPGETVVARVGRSLLLAHRLPELIAQTPEDYVAIATRLADDRVFFEAMRSRAAERSGSHLFCTQRRIRELETAYQQIWKQHLSGLPSVDIDIPDASERSGE